MADFEFDPEKLAAQTDEVNRQKRLLSLMGGIGDTFASANSVGNFALGKMNGPSIAVSKAANGIADTYEDPMKQQSAKMDLAKRAYEGKEMAGKQKFADSLADDNSAAAKAYKYTLQKAGIDVNGSTASDLYAQGYSPAKMAEIKARAQIDFDNDMRKQNASFQNQKTIKGMELSAEAQKHNRNEAEKRAAENAKNAKLTDKQIEALTDLDNAESDIGNIQAMLGNNTGWTGPLDGRVPDIAIGSDQVAFRSALGKYKDAYRKAVTGAGASNAEVAKLEGRLPSETDTYENFKAKAAEAAKEIQRRRNTSLGNFEKAGKSVAEYRKGEKTIVNRQVNPKTGESRVVYNDGTTEIVGKTQTAGR